MRNESNKGVEQRAVTESIHYNDTAVRSNSKPTLKIFLLIYLISQSFDWIEVLSYSIHLWI